MARPPQRPPKREAPKSSRPKVGKVGGAARPVPPPALQQESLPPASLAGRVVLNTREAHGAHALTRLLVQVGATVLEQPAIAFLPPPSWEAFDAQARRLTPTDWVAFTSATAVEHTLARLKVLGLGATPLARAHVAVVGPGTARALASHGLTPELMPGHFQAEDMLALLLAHLPPKCRVWLPRSAQGRATLVQGLAQAGHQVADTPAYVTGPPAQGLEPQVRESLLEARVDWLLFTSPSTVFHFWAMLAEDMRQALHRGRPKVACLGTVTAQAATELGLTVQAKPRQQDLVGLVAAVAQWEITAQREM